MELDKAIKSRKSVRKFKTKKPDWRKIIDCIDSARYAPMAGNNFSLRFILVDNKENIKKISEACQQPFVSQANYVVIFCSDTSRTANAYGKKAKIFCRQQAGAGIQNFLLEIQEKGLSTCWIGYFVEKQIKNILQVPEDINIEAIFPIGYEMGNAKPKPKIELDNTLYFNSYRNKRMKPMKKLEV